MRTKAGRWTGGRGSFTYGGAPMDLAAITGDFNGGYVRVDATALELNPTAGNWIQLQVTVDGVPQGPSRIIWQASGQSNVQVVLGHSVRVPSGRHRIAVQLQSSNPGAWAGNGGVIEVNDSPA